ncbi:MAG TPA: carboxypeptidase regulatory-like domain-containing protein [Bacteroidota bacterium]|nr:carboxypeptidase regulatory-like domain-containing protein [Bacteroidota bacterium]
MMNIVLRVLRATGALVLLPLLALSQGVTTGSLTGLVTDEKGEALPGANVIAVHEPSGTQYGTAVRTGGLFDIPNMRVGGPYTITVSFVGYRQQKKGDIYLSLGQTVRVDFQLAEETIAVGEVTITAQQDEVLNSGRTGAATYVRPEQVIQLPTIKRSTRDLTRLDPRSDGNFSFGGRNWLYNNISLDGSYFNNPFGLDDPAPGGQTNAEPVPYEAIEQVQVSLVPFDVRQGGFTGANINSVTKSGTNVFHGSLYSFVRNENLLGNEVKGKPVIARPDLSFNQSGFTVSGPIIPNTLFFFLNAELERRDDPGTNFIANRSGGSPAFGVSRVRASTMDSIRNRMKTVYGYETGPYEGYIHETNNDKILAKLDWNINENNALSFRFNLLDASRDLPPHPFVLSVNSTGRGPNENSLPFQNSGYRINNKLKSYALEVNSRSETFANRFFVSYNRFRDFREPFSQPFPTVEIGENGVTYTTVGHEPFSIHNILDQDVWQITNNFSYFSGKHVITVGANYESFSFFNSFNIFRHGIFFLPYFVDFQGDGIPEGSTFPTLAEFFAATDPNRPGGPIKLREMVGKGPFKGEDISVGQLAFYVQDEYLISENLNLTFGLRVDMPMYFTEPVDNPFSRALQLRDENGNPERLDQSKLPDVKLLFSPRVGFNWDVEGDRSTQVRGGTGIFTGRIPFVWYGNNISNPGPNPNLYPQVTPPPAAHKTSDDAVLQQSFDVNVMDPEFKWPQVWTTNIAVDHKLPWDLLGTLEIIYGKDINAVFVRNANLGAPVRKLPDGRPFYGGSRMNTFVPVGTDTIPFFGGVYVIDNTDEGYNFTVTAQLRKNFDFGLNTMIAYSYLEAKNVMKSTEIASVLWAENPTQGDPNKPELGFSEFGNRHRIVGNATYRHKWSESLATSFGVFIEIAEGNRFLGAGGNRYSFVYAGDVNGDGNGGNDLIYIPKNQNEILFDPYTDASGNTVTAAQQWAAFNAFIEQDDYLKENRGKIAERFGAVNPWFTNIDLRILQDFAFDFGGRPHTFQLSIDILNFANLLNSDWGVRQAASSAATAPLQLVRYDAQGAPVFNFKGTATKTYVDDLSILSRWQLQLGLKYSF